MSRIGKSVIPVPPGVKVTISGATVEIEGPLGKNKQTFDASVEIKFADDTIGVFCSDDGDPHSCAMHGTVRSIVNSMVIGVTRGFVKSLEINGVGFKAAMKPDNVLFLDLGYSHDIFYDVPAGITIEIDQSGTKLVVRGVDKQTVGQVAADIKRFYPVEPYKGKGVRIVGEFVRRKEGKKTA